MTVTAMRSRIRRDRPPAEDSPQMMLRDSAGRLRRRPALIALGAVLAALGGLAAAWYVLSAGDRVPVLAVVQPVAEGEVIEAADLARVRMPAEPLLSPLPADQFDSVVGQRAAVALVPGALLVAEQLTTDVVPAAGDALVGVSLTRAQMPAEPLTPGMDVLLVSTPKSQDEPALAEDPDTMPATVVRVSAPDANGLVVVDVLVPDDDGPHAAALAATNRVSLVVTSVEDAP